MRSQILLVSLFTVLVIVLTAGSLSALPVLANLSGQRETLFNTDSPVSDILSSPEIVQEAFKKACFRDFQNPDMLHIEFGETPPHKLIGGFFSSLSIKAAGGGVDYVKLSGFHMECKGVHFDLPSLMSEGKLDVRLVDKMDMSVSVREEAFNSLFSTHSGRMDVKNPHIKMLDDEISFSGTVKAFLFKSRVNARGPLEITPEGKVNFNLNRLKVSGVNLPGFMVRKISSTINPIADFNKFKFWKCWNMNLKTVLVKPGLMTLSSYEKQQPEFVQIAESGYFPNKLSEPKKG